MGLGLWVLLGCSPRIQGVSGTSVQLDNLLSSPSVSARVYLEGPMSGTPPQDPVAQALILDQRKQLPVEQPFGAPPFHHLGSERMLPSAREVLLQGGFVDWILVAVRAPAPPYARIASRAGLILPDGTVVDMDGASPLRFRNMPRGQYRISVQTRNHLAGLSAATVSLGSADALQIDLTATDSFLAPGNHSSSAVQNGKAYLVAGDLNGDGKIDPLDEERIVEKASEFPADPCPEDLNGDGVVDLFDILIAENNKTKAYRSPLGN